jgi:hypothetical protein
MVLLNVRREVVIALVRFLGMVMKKTSGGDSPLRQGARKSFWTLPISRR